MGVARLNFGGGWRAGMDSGGIAAMFDMGGAAALLTGRWLGDEGIARPSRGTLPPCWRPAPGMGGRRSGAGEDMMARSTSAAREELSSATMGRAVQWLSKRSALLTASWRVGGEVETEGGTAQARGGAARYGVPVVWFAMVGGAKMRRQ